MNSMMTTHFNESAAKWDTPEKIQKARETALKIKNALNSIDSSYHIKQILEVGCGTGLLGGQFITDETSYIGIDSSSEMLNVLKAKFPNPQVQIFNYDIEAHQLPDLKYDIVISQMAFHHLNSPQKVIQNLKKQEPRYIAIIDLDKEDGTFHPDPKAMGVKHFGFSHEEIKAWAQSAEMNLKHYEIINTIEKNNKTYHQFLAILG